MVLEKERNLTPVLCLKFHDRDPDSYRPWAAKELIYHFSMTSLSLFTLNEKKRQRLEPETRKDSMTYCHILWWRVSIASEIGQPLGEAGKRNRVCPPGSRRQSCWHFDLASLNTFLESSGPPELRIRNFVVFNH